jgi:hypothetical protein
MVQLTVRMGSLFRRYPNLNRGLVLLVTLVLPPATAAAVLHALSQERPALVAPHTIEARPAAEATVQAADEEATDETLEPAAPVVALSASLVRFFSAPSVCEAPGSTYRPPAQGTHDALLTALAPRAPPA